MNEQQQTDRDAQSESAVSQPSIGLTQLLLQRVDAVLPPATQIRTLLFTPPCAVGCSVHV